LCYGKSVIKITQRVKLPVFLFDSDEELLDAFKRQFITLNEDTNGVGHEFCRHLENIIWQGGAEKHDLRSRREIAVDVINLILETFIEKFIRLVQDEHLDIARAECAPPNHVEHPAGSARDDVLAVFEFTYVFTDGRAANTRMALHVHVVAQREYDGLDLGREFTGGREDECLRLSHGDIDGLQHGNREGSRFTRSGLCLRDHIAALRDGEDGTLLDGRGLFKVCTDEVLEDEIREKGEHMRTVGVNASQKVLLQTKVIKSRDDGDGLGRLEYDFLHEEVIGL
jgi:hypothetical protein